MRAAAIDNEQSLIQRPPGLQGNEPAWRWKRAIELATKYRVIPPYVERDDPIMAGAAWLYRTRNGGSLHMPADEPPLNGAYTDVSAAYDIWSQPGYLERRWTFEAFILVDTPGEDIAAYTAQPVGVVMAFERLFFDIRRLLKYPFIVMAMFTDPLFRGGRPEREFRLKLVAQVGGAEMLAQYLQPGRQFTPGQQAKLVQVIHGTLRRREFQRALDGFI